MDFVLSLFANVSDHHAEIKNARCL